MKREQARLLAQALVSQMTLEEKASQLRFDAPAIERLGIPEYNWWNEALHGVARGGTATVFPQAIGLAATFDDALVERIAEAAPSSRSTTSTRRKSSSASSPSSTASTRRPAGARRRRSRTSLSTGRCRTTSPN